MAKLHFVKRAQTDNPAAGIKKGDSYWYVTRRITVGKSFRSQKQIFKTRPRQSQIVSSEYERSILQAQEAVEDGLKGEVTIDDALAMAEDLKSQMEELSQAQDEKFNNMPEGFQQGETGQLLEERRDQCQQVADDLDSVTSTLEDLKAEIEDQESGCKVKTAEEISQAIVEAFNDISWP